MAKTMKNGCIPTKNYRLILSAVHMVYRLVNSTYNTKELLLRLTRLICQLIHADSACVFILDPSKKKIALVAKFNNKINMLIEKRDELQQIPPRQKEVCLGHDIIQKRLIGLPLVADDHIGAILIYRRSLEPPFTDFDREILMVIAEQAVTAIRNLQLYETQQRIILDTIESIGKLLGRHRKAPIPQTPVYFKVIKCLAEKIGMGAFEIDCLRYASILHETGSIDVPYEILSKTSRLTPEEFKVIKDHPAKSVELMRSVEFLRPVLPMILYHREKYDGTGYPSGLKKEQIPLGARIMAVADAFEAMIQGRPYKSKLTIQEAIAELNRNSGTQFDPHVVNAFCELYQQKNFRNYLSLLRNHT